MSVPSLGLRPIRAAWLAAFLAVACAPEPTMYQLEAPSLNKGGGKSGGGGGGGGKDREVTVSSVVPASGAQGEVLYMIKISGSNFESGAKVAWERNGVADPLVRVLATRFKSKTEIEVDIAIDESAQVTNYDVSVTLKSGKRGVGIEAFAVKEKGRTTDPTATWIIPNAGYSLRSDNHSLYTAGGLSTYADGVCGVGAKVFATTAASNSGDATIGMDAATGGENGCGRGVTLVYPDGTSETIRTFGNLQQLQNTTTLIPIGTKELRTLIINPGAYSNNPTRCGRLLFGQGSLGSGGGSDQVWVERVDARTWHVYSQDEPNTKVWCRDQNSMIDMTVSLTIVASRNLPW